MRRKKSFVEPSSRALAASGPLPPALAAHFTTSQLSVLAIVADEDGANGQCTLYLDEIAARAGTWPGRPEAAILARLKNVVGTRRPLLTADLAGNDVAAVGRA